MHSQPLFSQCFLEFPASLLAPRRCNWFGFDCETANALGECLPHRSGGRPNRLWCHHIRLAFSSAHSSLFLSSYRELKRANICSPKRLAEFGTLVFVNRQSLELTGPMKISFSTLAASLFFTFKIPFFRLKVGWTLSNCLVSICQHMFWTVTWQQTTPVSCQILLSKPTSSVQYDSQESWPG